jgi:hypothetical protein
MKSWTKGQEVFEEYLLDADWSLNAANCTLNSHLSNGLIKMIFRIIFANPVFVIHQKLNFYFFKRAMAICIYIFSPILACL